MLHLFLISFHLTAIITVDIQTKINNSLERVENIITNTLPSGVIHKINLDLDFKNDGNNGLLGGALVWFELNPYIKTAHMLFALILVSILSYICIKSYKMLNSNLFKGLTNNLVLLKSLIFLWILIVIEILLGTGLRTNIELIVIENPLFSKSDQLDALPYYKYMHSILGFALLFFSIYVNYNIFLC